MPTTTSSNRVEFEWQEDDATTNPINVDRETITAWIDQEVVNAFPANAQPIKPWGQLGERVATLQFIPRQESQIVKPETVTIALARSTSNVDATIAQLRGTVLRVGIAGLIVSLGLTWLAVRFGLKPIVAVTRQITGIQADSLNQRIETIETQPAELRPLSQTINSLLQRLEQTFERERSFSADVAHELRTPLAGLQAKLDVALAQPREPDSYQRTLSDCQEITTQTSAIVAALLATTRSTCQANHSTEVVHLHRLIDRLCADFEETILDRRLEIQLNIPRELTIESDPQILTMIIRNLLDNATSYSDPNSTITITSTSTANQTKITFDNQASDFPAHDIDKVFDRFWRSDTARTATGTHAGLGLTLTRRLVESICGSIGAYYNNGHFQVSVCFATKFKS
ncbi:Sensor kinase CusS [Stieleria neptunia]|uniref:histidine kinase n=1 Tax=Stieleria neptunia TaxID=2527979 RepID=A0A518I3A0_9BACT|nr:ATP-binding protein [Stieleria neptunia]QDV47582.1 Sensor kinase CusS [Stieleria neptunia]